MSAAKGISLHIGLNRISEAHYGPQVELAGCVRDARDMAALAKKRGFKGRRVLVDSQGTSRAVLGELTAIARQLEPGDIFFITYSGHGSQVKDDNGDNEEDDADETWCLYDRMLIDDELYDAWGRFAPGVRILMLSDSCHSGTMARAVFNPPGSFRPPPPPPSRDGGPLNRMLPEDNLRRAFDGHREQYRKIQRDTPSTSRAAVAASVLLISGCQDFEESEDGDRNGRFTATMLKVYDRGKFTRGYRAFHKEILRRMPDRQRPNLFTTGARNVLFERQAPFTI
jgi:hypothetical protein